MVELSPTATPTINLDKPRLYKFTASPNRTPIMPIKSVIIMEFVRLTEARIGPARIAPNAAPIGSKAINIKSNYLSKVHR